MVSLFISDPPFQLLIRSGRPGNDKTRLAETRLRVTHQARYVFDPEAGSLIQLQFAEDLIDVPVNTDRFVFDLVWSKSLVQVDAGI